MHLPNLWFGRRPGPLPSVATATQRPKSATTPLGHGPILFGREAADECHKHAMMPRPLKARSQPTIRHPLGDLPTLYSPPSLLL